MNNTPKRCNLLQRIKGAIVYVFTGANPDKGMVDGILANLATITRDYTEVTKQCLVISAQLDMLRANYVPLNELARVAYEGYCGTRGWLSFKKEPLPQWPEVSADIKDGWEAAANAVYMRLFDNTHPEGINKRG